MRNPVRTIASWCRAANITIHGPPDGWTFEAPDDSLHVEERPRRED